MRRHAWLVLPAIGLLLALAASFNFIYEPLGPNAKYLFVGNSLLCMVAGLLLRLSRRARARYLVGLYVAIGLPLGLGILIHDGNQYRRVQEEQTSFPYRVDQIVERTIKLYRSPYFPPALYGPVKRFLKKPYHPELWDDRNAYTSVAVSLFHLGTAGIISYEFSGRSLDEEPADLCFVFQGESGSGDITRHVRVEDCSGQAIQPCIRPLTLLGKCFACIGSCTVPERFCYRRSFCAPEAQGGARDGFVLNLDNLKYLPDSLRITLVSDQSLQNPTVFRLKRARFVTKRWLRADPAYHQEVVSALSRMNKTSLERIRNELITSPHPISQATKLVGWELLLTGLRPRDILLVAYDVDRWYSSR